MNVRMKISSHLQVYMWADSIPWREQYICYCRRSSFQTYHPYTLNFPDSQAGQSLIALLNVCHPSLDDGTKIGNNFESCNIVSCFFYFGDKIKGFMAISVVPFHSFLRNYLHICVRFITFAPCNRITTLLPPDIWRTHTRASAGHLPMWRY